MLCNGWVIFLMRIHRTLVSLFLFFILAPMGNVAFAAIPSAGGQGFGMQMLGGSTQVIEAMTQYQIMQMFQQQALKEEDRAAINFYKPFIAYLNTLDASTRNAVFNQALAQPLNAAKLPLIAFCENAYSAALANNVFTPDQQMRLKQDMAAALIEQANGVTNTSFSSFMKNALMMGLALGTVECMKRVIGDSLSRVVNKIPQVLSFMSRLASKGYNSLCNRPDPIQAEELMVWRTTFEGMINALCEQNVSGSLMLKNIRVGDDKAPVADENWLYVVEMVNAVCAHSAAYLQDRMPYYTGAQDQRAMLVGIANSVSMESRASIAFLSKIIINNLHNIAGACQKAETADDLDVAHIKKLGRITLLLFDKLNLMIAGAQPGQGMQPMHGMVESVG